MKKNLYFRLIYGRENLLKSYIFVIFLAISSYPRLLLEVFIRKNFGERYFTMASALTVLCLLAVQPLINLILTVMMVGADRYDWRGFFWSYAKTETILFNGGPMAICTF